MLNVTGVSLQVTWNFSVMSKQLQKLSVLT